MADLNLKSYKANLVPIPATIKQFHSIVSDYEAILAAVMQAIADRYDKNQGYNWVDTKINLKTGEDFAKDDPLKGLDTVYGWIQGRALEALAGHAIWLEKRYPNNEQAANLRKSLVNILTGVLRQLRQIRKQNAGHLFFFLTRQGVHHFLWTHRAIKKRLI